MCIRSRCIWRARWTFAARDALERSRDAGAKVDVTAPIYLGDSPQLPTPTQDLFATQTVTIEIEDHHGSGLERDRTFSFPRALVEQANWFDGPITRLADACSYRPWTAAPKADRAALY